MSDSEKAEDATPASFSDEQLNEISRAVAHGIAQGNEQLIERQAQLLGGLITAFRGEVVPLVEELRSSIRGLDESLRCSNITAPSQMEAIEGLRHSLSQTRDSMYELTSALRSSRG